MLSESLNVAPRIEMIVMQGSKEQALQSRSCHGSLSGFFKSLIIAGFRLVLQIDARDLRGVGRLVLVVRVSIGSIGSLRIGGCWSAHSTRVCRTVNIPFFLLKTTTIAPTELRCWTSWFLLGMHSVARYESYAHLVSITRSKSRSDVN